MIVKLSDFILEQTVSNADVIDISLEQAKAEIDVYSSLLDVYCKNINRGFVMEESTETFGDKIKRFFISIGNWFRKMWIKFLAYFSEKRLKRIVNKLSGMSSTEKSNFKGYLPFNTEGYVEKLKTFINISDKFSKMINTDVMNPDFEYNAEELKADLKKYKSLMKEAKSSKDSYSYNYKDYKDFMDELYSTYNESKTTLESIKKNFNPKNNDSNQNIDDARAKKLYGVVNRLYNSYSSEASAQITIIMRMINNAEKNKANAKAGYDGAADTLHMTEKYDEIVQKFNSLNGKAQNEFKERLSKCHDKINKHDMAGSFKENQPLAKEVMSELTALEKDIDEYIKNEPIKKKQQDDEDKSTIEALIKEAKELIKKLEEDEKTIVKKADSLHDRERYQAQTQPSYDIKKLKERLEKYVSDYETGKFDDKSINISFLKSVITDAKRIDSDITSVKQKQTPDAYKKEYERKLDNLIKTISTAIDAFVKKGYMTHETGKYVKDTISTKSSGAREYETAISYVTKVTDKWDVFNKGGHLAVFIGKAMPLIFVYYKENALLTALDRNFSYGQPLGIPEKSKIHCSDATAEDFESNIRLIQREDSNIRQETKEFNEKSKNADENFRKNHESFEPEEILSGANGSEKDEKETKSEKKKAEYFSPDKKTVDSVKAIKTAKQRVFTYIQNFINDFTKEYGLIDDDAFRFNLNTNDYDSPQLTEISNKLDKFCKSKPANVSEKHIKDLSEIAGMINSVSKLLSDPNNFGPNFIADMAEYSKKAMALFREFDSGKKQKGSNATKKENESTDASKKPSTSEKQSKTVEKDTKDEQQIPEDRLRRLEKALDETFKLTKPLGDRKYWKNFPELYDEYKKIYDRTIKCYQDMRGKLNTNEVISYNNDYGNLRELAYKLSGDKTLKHSVYALREIINSLQLSVINLFIYDQIPRKIYSVDEKQTYLVATCEDSEFNLCIKDIEEKNIWIAEYYGKAEKLLKEQKDSTE